MPTIRTENGKYFNGPQIYSLEIDYTDNDDNDNDNLLHEEMDSLMKETNGSHNNIPLSMNHTDDEEIHLNHKSTLFWNTTTATMTRNYNFRQRFNTAVTNVSNFSYNDTDTTKIRGFIRSQIGNASTARNFKVVTALALLSVFAYTINSTIISQTSGSINTDEGVNRYYTPHTPSFGGNMNSNHYIPTDDSWYTTIMGSLKNSFVDSTNNNNNDNAGTDDSVLPSISNVGSTVRSISIQNRENKIGHYIHDPLQSPYTSPYYAIWKNTSSATEQLNEQTNYEMKMKSYAIKYGQWNTPYYSETLTIPDFTTVADGTNDLLIDDFQVNAWQSDSTYVKDFLHEAKALVSRVKEGIYEEYGYGILKKDISTIERDQIVSERLQKFQIYIQDNINIRDGAAFPNHMNDDDYTIDDAIPAIAYLNQPGWDALVRKLLHCMMTHDIFYTVMVGHTNTYYSNNFQQSAIMEFNYIMEPVFDKLGMQLISRNMGMNATTTNSALGGADIYGEADIFWHIPDTRISDDDNTKKNIITESFPMIDFLYRQAILSGNRVPIILSPYTPIFIDGAKNNVWMGNIQPGASFCDPTYTQDGKTMVPLMKACRYVKCRSNPKLCDKHNSVCWVERSDRSIFQKQDNDVGHQREGYPSVQQQRLEGRKLSMMILHALEEALDRWMTQSADGLVPLPDDVWHVGKVYNEVREHVRTMKSGLCGRLFQKLDPRICHMEMHAYTEWTPRVDPIQSRLKGLIKDDIHIADNHLSLIEVYTEVALLPRQWKIPENDTDVHMIAIATDIAGIPPGKDTDKVQVNDVPNVTPWTDDDTMNWGSDPNEDSMNDHDYGFDDDMYGGRQRMLAVASDMTHHRRHLLTSDISSKMWTIFNAPIGFCDGSAQSSCNRNGLNTCLLANYNHYRAGIVGHGQAGKLVLSIPKVKEGLILARFDWQQENGPRVKYFPPDFAFDYTVNGIKKTMSRVDFAKAGFDLTQDLRVHILLLDNDFARKNNGNGQAVVIEMEVRSTKAGTDPLLLLSHLYYA
jgi:hypothetical protein